KAYTSQELATLLLALTDPKKAPDKKGLSVQLSQADMDHYAEILGVKNNAKVNGGFKLGLEIQKEIDFVDNVRAAGQAKPALDWADSVVVLRFPNDISNELLQEFGQFVSNYGYRNTIVQKLPFSAAELNGMGQQILKSTMASIENGTTRMQFSKREIALLKELVE
ncbi:MAG TPA: hypothetical protein VLI92_02565, partial [Candidatus Saccharimonadales bacterium]|nr:hypothetical protein [Candidatus Saccharimonadales bacterium]